MARWVGEHARVLWGRDAVPEHGMEIVKHGIDLPSYEMSGDAMNHTVDMINKLPLAEVQTMRYVHIGFGCWSAALALAVIARVWYDSWRAQKLSAGRHSRWEFLYNLHPAETFPLILGFMILMQALSFILIQGMALQTVFVSMCRGSATFVFTLIFALGWLHMVFGLDMTIRALKAPLLTVPERKKRTTLGLLGLAFVLILATWLSTRIRPAGDRCFGDIIFRTIRSSLLGIVFCAIMIPSFLIMAVVIGVRLRQTVLMDHKERIAGTRMVWYLVEAAIMYVFILPFYIQAMAGTFDPNFTSSRLAEFALFGSGSIICITHFILRANAARMAIKPNQTPWMKKRRFRLFGPSDLEIINISPPIIKDSMELETDNKWRLRNAGGRLLSSPTDSSPDSSVVGSSPPKPAPALYRRNWPLLDDMERPPTPAKTGAARRNSLPPKIKHKKQPSYSLFPAGEDELQLPATTYSPSATTKESRSIESTPRPPVPSLLPPFRPFAFDVARESTATLEIGMRFSSAPAAAAAAARSSTPPTQSKRPSLLTAIDDMLRDTTAATALSSHPVKTSDTFVRGKSSEPVLSSAAFHRRSQSSPDDAIHGTTTHTSSSDKYAWVDLPSGDATESSQAPARSTAEPPPDTRLHNHAKRLSNVPLTRSESLRRQAESNRLELANLERSGSGASRSRLRPAYPNPATPDDSVVGASEGDRSRSYF